MAKKETAGTTYLHSGAQMTALTRIYVEAIMEEIKTYAEVPSLYKKKVKDAFDDMLDLGEITQEEHDRYLGL